MWSMKSCLRFNGLNSPELAPREAGPVIRTSHGKQERRHASHNVRRNVNEYATSRGNVVGGGTGSNLYQDTDHID
jgi:hypothetical protein